VTRKSVFVDRVPWRDVSDGEWADGRHGPCRSARRGGQAGDAAHPHGLNEIVDRTGGDALNVSRLHYRGERPLGHPAPAVTVSLNAALRAVLAVARTRHGFDFQLHEPLGCKTDHLAQPGCCQQPDPTDESSMTTAKPLARYGAIWGALRERLRPGLFPAKH